MTTAPALRLRVVSDAEDARMTAFGDGEASGSNGEASADQPVAPAAPVAAVPIVTEAIQPPNAVAEGGPPR